jgi:hypothetical protein
VQGIFKQGIFRFAFLTTAQSEKTHTVATRRAHVCFTSPIRKQQQQQQEETNNKRDYNMSAIARQQKTKGDTFMEQAEATLTKKSWFSSKDRKNEEASEMFNQAGNAYKVGGFYYESGMAYMRAATILRDDLKNSFDASKAFQNAGECLS